MFSLKLNDWTRGLIVAVFSAVAISIAGIFASSGFDVFNVDWRHIINLAIQTGAASFIGYMTKNFLSDNRGAVLGTIAPAGK